MAEQFDVIDPATDELVERVPLASAADVDSAVARAKAAQPQWAAATPGERSAVLAEVAAALTRRTEEFAQLETRQCGKPIRLTREFDVPGTADNAAFFAGAARMLEGKASMEYTGDHTSTIRREPLGVVGAITPWNYPLNMAGWKVFPALATGNAVVLKPAEITPLTSTLLREVFLEAGLPEDVLQVVVGTGPEAGEALVRNDNIDAMSFTGSTAVGRRVAELCAAAPKKAQLELGGKAPFVVFDDADLDAAAHGALAGSLLNAGQDCTAAARAYVHRSQVNEFVDRLAELYGQVRVGATTDPATDLGSLSSRRHRDKVHAMVMAAQHDGAKVVCGGEVPDGPGAYYPPTIIIGAAQDSAIVQQEVFGPVLTVSPYDTDDEAIALANDTRYGLAASAWTNDVYRAQRASREVRAGAVWINDHTPIVSEMPHGGIKASGWGNDMSGYSLDEYTVIKHVCSDITGAARKPWHSVVFAKE